MLGNLRCLFILPVQVSSDPNRYKHFQSMARDDELAQELEREREMLDSRPKTPITETVKPLQPEYGGVSYIDNINGTPQVILTLEQRFLRL